MGEDGRSLIRSAQSAELQGDLDRARELLSRAAGLYETRGQKERADQLRRHAERLVPQASDREFEAGRAGPVLAPAELSAWCSFCCRPRAEIGPLVAGPADAFICATCLGESRALLGAPRAPAPAVPRLTAPTLPPQELECQRDARAAIEPRLGGELQAALFGPPGSGKSFWLQAWAAQGRGTALSAREALDGRRWGKEPLLIDELAALSESQALELAQRMRTGSFVLAVSGILPAPRLVLEGPKGKVAVLSSDELAMASGGALPVAVFEAVQLPVELQRLGAEDYQNLAHAWMKVRDHTLEPAWLQAACTAAQQSARGAHELIAILERIRAAAGVREGAP